MAIIAIVCVHMWCTHAGERGKTGDVQKPNDKGPFKSCKRSDFIPRQGRHH